jgi:transcriptional regulator with XRE-family HTH domain
MSWTPINPKDITRRRKALGLTIKELALESGIDPSNLSKMERGKRSIGVLMQDVLERTLDALEEKP